MKKKLFSIKIFLRTFSIFIGIGLFFTCAGFFWLHTSGAEHFIFSQLQKSLAKQGINISAESFSGPLPGSLHIKGLELADNQGVWLKSDSIDVSISFSSLVKGNITIDELQVDNPYLLRLPELNKNENSPSDKNKNDSSSEFSTPIGIIFDQVGIKKFTLEKDSLGKGVPEQQVHVTLSTSGDLKGSQLNTNLVASVDTSVLQKNSNNNTLKAVPLQLTTNSKIKANFSNNHNMIVSNGTIVSQIDNSPAHIHYQANFSQDGSLVTLNNFFLEGIGIIAQTKGKFDITSKALTADITLNAKDNGLWQKIIPSEQEQDKRLSLRGNLNISAHASSPGTDSPEGYPPIKGILNVHGSDMHWPIAVLEESVGNSVNLDVSVQGGKDSPYTLSIDNFIAGIFTGKGTINYTATTSNISSDIKFSVKDIEPLYADMHGPTTLSITSRGSVLSPEINVSITSPQLITVAGNFTDIKGNSKTKISQINPLTASGNIALMFYENKTDTVNVTGSWKAFIDSSSEKKSQISLHDLSISGGGVLANADFDVKIQKPLPIIEGKIFTKVTDWKNIAAFTHTDLTGKPASLSAIIRASNKADITLDAPYISLGKDIFEISDLKSTITATGISSNPFVIAQISSNKGSVSTFPWTEMQGNFKGYIDNADFQLHLIDNESYLEQKKNTPSKKMSKENLALQGTLKKGSLNITTLQARMPKEKIQANLVTPVEIAFSPNLSIQKFLVNIEEIPINNIPKSKKLASSVQSEVSLIPGKTKIKATVKDFPFYFISKLANIETLPEGKIDVDVDLEQKNGPLQGKISLVSQIQSSSGLKQSSTIPVTVALQGTMTASPSGRFSTVKAPPGASYLNGVGTVSSEGKTYNLLSFDIPLSNESIPTPLTNAPFAAKIFWNGPISPLWKLAPITDRELTGLAAIDMGITGTMVAPKTFGTIYFSKGTYQDKIMGVLLTDIEVEAKNSETKNISAIIKLGDGKGGTAAMEAKLTPGKNNLAKTSSQQTSKNSMEDWVPQIALRGQINHLAPLHRDDGTMQFSGIVGVNGAVSSPKITATIEVERGEVNLQAALGNKSVQTLPISVKNEPIERKRRKQATCDINISIPKRFFIRGLGMDSEWAGNLKITKSPSNPNLTGSLHPINGQFDLLSHPFKFSKGEITFVGGEEINPGLDLKLINKGARVEAIVNVTGNAKQPSITLESMPSMPQDEIIAEVLFGKSSSSLSRFEAIQVANAASELSGNDGFLPFRSVRKKLGIDVLRVGSESSNEERRINGENKNIPGQSSQSTDETTTNPTIEAGKYINDSIYVGVEQGFTADSTGAKVEIELMPSVSLQGKTSTRSSEVGISWKMDY